MLSLTHAGSRFRSKPMDRDRAERFARCISANERFTEVFVQESKSAGKFYVSYLPASQARQADMLATHQTERLQRALAEGDGYTFVLDDSRTFFWCLSVSGEVYETTEHNCSCPDHTYRCSKAGLKCKHQLALLNGQGTFRSWQPKPAMSAERLAQVRKDRELWG